MDLKSARFWNPTAERDIFNKDGETISDIAVRKRNEAMIKAILNYKIKENREETSRV